MTKAHTRPLYYIQQVSDMTGLSKQVIRKWEERFNLVQPIRLENGYRMYNELDINVIMKVKLLSEQGLSIKQAVQEVENDKLSADISSSQELNTPQRKFEEMNDFVFQLLEKGTHCDELELNLALQKAYHHFSLETFLNSVVVPFLKEVGNRWEKNEWDEYQESVSSMVVRDFLVQIRRNFKFRENAPLLIGACLPFEQHEIPLHIILLKFMIKGWKTQLIGASPAPGSIESLINKLKPVKVVLSASTTLPFEKEPQLLQSLDKFALNNPSITFYLGGAGSIKYTENIKLKAIKVINTIEKIEDAELPPIQS